MTNSNSQPLLAELALEINEHDKARRACEVKGVMHGLKVGQLLIEAKKIVPHGQFSKWREDNTGVTQRMAQIYMAVARDERILDLVIPEYETVSHLTINKAVELIREKKNTDQLVQKINEVWKQGEAHMAWMNDKLREVRPAFDEHGGNDRFQEWISKECGLSESLAAKFVEAGEITTDDVLSELCGLVQEEAA